MTGPPRRPGTSTGTPECAGARHSVRPYGAQGWLVEPDDPSQVVALAAAARELPGVDEVVPAARTFLVLTGRPGATGPARTALEHLSPQLTPPSAAASVTLPVHYDGPDLADVAIAVGLDPDGVVRAHSAAAYTVAFCGFAPGFGYLSGLPDRLRLPRLAEPRSRVPAGSVAIADAWTGVYPRASPGGWRLLGRTDTPLWDLARTPPALLTPGTEVRFAPRRA